MSINFNENNNGYEGRNSWLDRNKQLRENMAYFAPEKSFLMDREEIKVGADHPGRLRKHSACGSSSL